MQNTILPILKGGTATAPHALQAISYKCFQHIYKHNLLVNKRATPYRTNSLYISNRLMKLTALKVCNVTREKN